MKTILVILITLYVSQHVYEQYGPHNVLNDALHICTDLFHWCVNSVVRMAK